MTAMGSMPKPNSKLPENVRLRVKWLLDVDLLMKDLSELAATNEDAYCEVYNDSTIKTIKSYFPIKIHTQMSGFEGTARDKFGQISDLVDKLHKDNRGLLADLDRW